MAPCIFPTLFDIENYRETQPIIRDLGINVYLDVNWETNYARICEASELACNNFKSFTAG